MLARIGRSVEPLSRWQRVWVVIVDAACDCCCSEAAFCQWNRLRVQALAVTLFTNCTGASHTQMLQALAIADDDGTSDRLTAVERELLHHMINTEHDLVVTAFEVLPSHT